MSFFTQKFANNFPLWSAVRSDPSSFGHRLLKPYAEILENKYADSVRLRAQNNVLSLGSAVYDLPFVYYVELSRFGISLFPDRNLSLSPNFPIVQYEVDGATLGVERAASWADFYSHSTTGELEYKESAKISRINIWCSDQGEAGSYGQLANGGDPTGLNDALPFRLAGSDPSYTIGVSVQGSTHYKIEGNEEDAADGPFLGRWVVVVRGKDENNHPIESEVPVLDDGFYTTDKKFASVEKIRVGGVEKPAVEYDGFNGVVRLQVTDANHERKTCPFLTAHVPENQSQADVLRDLESPLVFGISEEDGISGSYLDSYFKPYALGIQYRRNNFELDLEDEESELIASQYLLDQFDTPYRAVDFAFNLWDCKIYILDDIGRIHVHEASLTPFDPWSLPRTKQIGVEVKPLARRAVYGEAMPCWTWHRIIRNPIYSVAVLRESPKARRQLDDLSNFLEAGGEYLQGDGSWSSSKHLFYGDLDSDGLPEKGWTDKKFTIDFPAVGDGEDPHDVLGQWNFYVETTYMDKTRIQSKALEVLHDDGIIDDAEYWRRKEVLVDTGEPSEVLRASTAVMVDYSRAEKTYGTAEAPVAEGSSGIYIDALENLVCCIKDFQIIKFRSVSHKWMPDARANAILLRENYNEIFITQDGMTTRVEMAGG